MVLLSKTTTEQFSYIKNCMASTFSSTIPIVDLSKPDAKTLIVKACEEFGFFKVINHGVPMEPISQLETETLKFFSMPLNEKEKQGLPTHLEHGFSPSGKNAEKLRGLLTSYMSLVKKMACDILELMAEGLKIQQKNVFSKLLMDKQSDSVFRVNHYPACPELAVNGQNMIGFGEHTDPQIISLLRSNNTSGLQIYLRDGSWIPVPPDHNSFFINVGDSLQVMTNGRFRSVRHRVLANGFKSRLSMIYFGGPPLSEKIAPLPSLIKGKQSLYNEFTWFEYKNSTYGSKLADNRLGHFERIAAS
ncbi:hypothetical protein ACSQ67_010170 [Phaseolus vulgaris]